MDKNMDIKHWTPNRRSPRGVSPILQQNRGKRIRVAQPSTTKPRVIILGAGRPHRGDRPSALLHTSGEKRVLDWTLEAFNQVMQAEVHFVSGYRLDDIVSTYPDIHISVNPNWESQGSLGSLLAAPLNPGQTTYVCYADIVIASGSHHEIDVRK